ncbi:hypothetical protein KIPB_005546 [Kipferlia bialata]|uniref:Uncharacterized protein n=1 Tax=Kipferlia bialata TaxID=797122 RepID=A0A391NRI9_9EUKA|nr:hypothetical protein KIPB_005546 [Kipferlia bialata]|eukprot:g5546.t1
MAGLDEFLQVPELWKAEDLWTLVQEVEVSGDLSAAHKLLPKYSYADVVRQWYFIVHDRAFGFSAGRALNLLVDGQRAREVSQEWSPPQNELAVTAYFTHLEDKERPFAGIVQQLAGFFPPGTTGADAMRQVVLVAGDRADYDRTVANTAALASGIKGGDIRARATSRSFVPEVTPLIRRAPQTEARPTHPATDAVQLYEMLAIERDLARQEQARVLESAPQQTATPETPEPTVLPILAWFQSSYRSLVVRKEQVTIGSGRDCDLCLPGLALSPIQVVVERVPKAVKASPAPGSQTPGDVSVWRVVNVGKDSGRPKKTTVLPIALEDMCTSTVAGPTSLADTSGGVPCAPVAVAVCGTELCHMQTATMPPQCVVTVGGVPFLFSVEGEV